MIHAIIYANRENRGFDLYEETPGFPSSCRGEIHTLCSSFSCHPHAAPSALRCAPSADGSYTLLTVIFRQSGGTREQARAHCTAVTFLLEEAEAHSFFRRPFSAAAGAITAAGEEILCDPAILEEGFASLEQLLAFRAKPTVVKRRQIPDHLLLGGALREDSQLFLSGHYDASRELDALFSLLPTALCRFVRFHTDVLSGAESRGVTLAFVCPEVLRELTESRFAGGPACAKFWHTFPEGSFPDREDTGSAPLYRSVSTVLNALAPYPFFREAVTNRDELYSLARHPVRAMSPDTALSLLSEESLLRAIGRLKLWPSELDLLAKHLPGKYRRARQAVAEKTPYCTGDKTALLGVKYDGPLRYAEATARAKASARTLPPARSGLSRRSSGVRLLPALLLSVLSLGGTVLSLLSLFSVSVTRAGAAVIVISAQASHLMAKGGTLCLCSALFGFALSSLLRRLYLPRRNRR